MKDLQYIKTLRSDSFKMPILM